MANKKVVVDPVTRIEGHLRMQAVLDENNVIVDAMSTGTMWRGLEVILKGRDPRDAWAFVERVCGVCTGIHALSAVRAVEDALGIQIPKNAKNDSTVTFSVKMVSKEEYQQRFETIDEEAIAKLKNAAIAVDESAFNASDTS